MSMRKDFEAFMKRREEAARAYVKGDPEPVNQLATVLEPASFFSPDGSVAKGPVKIKDIYREGSAQFDTESESKLEILQMAAGARQSEKST